MRWYGRSTWARQRGDGSLALLDVFLGYVDEVRLKSDLLPARLTRGDLLLAISPENMPRAFEIYDQILAVKNQSGGKILELQVATRLIG